MNNEICLRAETLAALMALDADVWDHYTLSQDPLYPRLPAKRRRELILQAREAGEEMARRIQGQYDTGDLRALCLSLGATVRQVPGEEACGVYFLAQFREPDQILLAEGLLREMETTLGRAFSRLPPIPVERLLLAHELYHLLECRNPEWTSCVMTVPYWRLGPWQWNRRLVSASEIGAMAFARALTGISWGPQLLDVLMIYGREPEAAARLADRILSLRGGEME